MATKLYSVVLPKSKTKRDRTLVIKKFDNDQSSIGEDKYLVNHDINTFNFEIEDEYEYIYDLPSIKSKFFDVTLETTQQVELRLVPAIQQKRINGGNDL